MTRTFVFALWIGLVSATAALALEIPPAPSIHVYDGARWLRPDQRATLADELLRYERETSNQMIVATFESLEGDNLEDACNRIAEAWGIGRGDRDNGILLAVFDAERKVRIEVGYGLEGAVTDLISHQIIQDEILPLLRQGDRFGGLQLGARSLMAASRGEYEGSGRALGDREKGKRSPWGGIIWFLILLFFMFMRGRGGRGGRGGPMIFFGGGGGFGGGVAVEVPSADSAAAAAVSAAAARAEVGSHGKFTQQECGGFLQRGRVSFHRGLYRSGRAAHQR